MQRELIFYAAAMLEALKKGVAVPDKETEHPTIQVRMTVEHCIVCNELMVSCSGEPRWQHP